MVQGRYRETLHAIATVARILLVFTKGLCNLSWLIEAHHQGVGIHHGTTSGYMTRQMTYILFTTQQLTVIRQGKLHKWQQDSNSNDNPE